MKCRIWLLSVLALLVASCSPTSTTERPVDTIIIGIESDIQSWNPFLAEDASNEEILALIYPSLAVEQTDYQNHPPSFEPSLAESWQYSDDGLELTLTLRDDAVWSDGVPVTPEDVLFSWRAQTSEALGWMWSDITDNIQEVEKIDDRTVRFTFTHRYPYQLMDVNDGPIVPAHAWAEIPFEAWEETDWSDHVLSAGPYRVASHTRQQEIVLEKNPTYWVPDRPRIARIVFRVVPSKNSLFTQFLAGELDLVNGVPPTEATKVQTDPDLELRIFQDRSYTHVCWNVDNPLFADENIRRALGLAIDRQTLIDVVYEGFARPSIGPVLSTMWAFNQELEPLAFDPSEATRLLNDAGWEDSDGDGILDRDGQEFSFEILAPSVSEVRQDVALMIERDLGRIGIEVVPRFIEWGAVQAAVSTADFDAFVNRWIEPTQVDLEGIWRSTPPDIPTFNFGRYANAEVDHLLDEVAMAADFETQKPLLDRIQEIIVADQPYTFLVENVRLVGVNSRISGADINDAAIFFNIEDWYIDQ
ncbi:MAG: ABC transporter substrate-binding protein [Acidobacteria bacterium]|nr:ABC transporter substrate-binding protein [Acidobacteriota bacterium]